MSSNLYKLQKLLDLMPKLFYFDSLALIICTMDVSTCQVPILSHFFLQIIFHLFVLFDFGIFGFFYGLIKVFSLLITISYNSTDDVYWLKSPNTKSKLSVSWLFSRGSGLMSLLEPARTYS